MTQRYHVNRSCTSRCERRSKTESSLAVEEILMTCIGLSAKRTTCCATGFARTTRFPLSILNRLNRPRKRVTIVVQGVVIPREIRFLLAAVTWCPFFCSVYQDPEVICLSVASRLDVFLHTATRPPSTGVSRAVICMWRVSGIYR